MSDVDVMVYDMFGSPPRALNETQKSRWGMMPWAAHELSPKGVPGDYDWFAGARPGLWANFAGAITPWGQVYEASTGSPVTDVRIHIRNMELYFLHADGVWRLHGEWNVFEGGYWTPDFAKGLGSVAFRDEPEGGQSFVPQPDRVAHWWNGTSPRPSVPPDAVAVHVRVQVRLIPNSDPLADLSAARYVANQSADSYRSPNGGWLGDIAMPRLKLITPQWQWFTMTTLYEAELRANPPPPLLPPASMPDDGDGQSPPTGVPGLTVTPASPYRAGLNPITVVGGGAPSAIADVVATESRRAVIALWLLQDDAWLYFLPQAPERSTLHSVSPAPAALFVELG